MADPTPRTDSISFKIKELRAEKGWTQSRLASEAGISGAALSKIESGGKRIPTIVVLRKLASALGVSVYEITGEEPANRTEEEARYSSFYRKWGLVEDLPEEDQKRLLDMAERLKDIRKDD